MAGRSGQKPPALQLEDDEEPKAGEGSGIEVVDDTVDPDTGTATDVVTDSVESLKAQLEEERQRREAAEAKARTADTSAQSTATRLLETQMQAIDNALAKEDSLKKAARQKYIEAKERGDYAAEADAQDELQQINLRISRMSEGKTELDRRLEDAKSTPADPVEQYVRGMAPRAADWVRSHAEYVTDPSKRSDLEAAHFTVLGRRIPEGSPQYFAAVEEELGLRDAPQRQQQDEPPRRGAPPAAPPSRQNGTSVGRITNLPDGVTDMGGGKYRLSPLLREYARIAGLSDKDYLDNLLAAHRAGEIGTRH